MFHKILVAVDRSSYGETVFDTAIALAKSLNAEVMLLHVLSNEDKGCPQMPTLTTLEYYPVSSNLFDDYWKHWQVYEQQGLELLQAYTAKAAAAGVSIEFTQSSGSAGRGICELARSWEADLVVLGHRGHAGVQELILGSVSNYVMHHAPCAVLTVHSPAQTRLQARPGAPQQEQLLAS
jgi:nucleotide-binding universal stress UspA family protein